MSQNEGVTPSGSGHQPSASAPICVGSSQSGVPNAWEFPEKLFAAWVECKVDLPEQFSAMIGEAAALLGHMRETHDALMPFADGVFNDNGDLTIRSFFDAEHVERAYFVHRRTRFAIEAAEQSVSA